MESGINQQPGQEHRHYTVAVVQMDSGADRAANLAHAAACIDEAAAAGAQLVSFPETMSVIVPVPAGDAFENIPGPTTELMSAKAREHGIWIHSGTFYERIPGDDRAYNASVLVNPAGEIVTHYRKLHTFDVTLPDGTPCNESDQVCPGTHVATAETPLGAMGLATCYDVRFPELFRAMALEGAQIIFMPANFTAPTGRDHWEVLLRARAIENGCYVIAANQCGQKPEFEAYGNSMIIDPWGRVLARAATEPTILYGTIDLDELEQVRSRIPVLQHRRTDIYG